MVREFSYLKERTRNAKENLGSLVTVVVVLSFVISLSTNLLSQYIWEEHKAEKVLFGSAVLTTLLTAGVIYSTQPCPQDWSKTVMTKADGIFLADGIKI